MTSDRIRRVSFFGAPGAGKSRNSAWLFSQLKDLGYHCEQVPEWVKKLAHKKEKLHHWSQLQIFTEQLLSEYVLLDSDPDIILISDSPLCLGWMYSEHNGLPYAEDLKSLWRKYQQSSPKELIIRLESGGIPYNPKGRWQTKDESMALDAEFLSKINAEGVEYTTFQTTEREQILAHVVANLNNKQGE